MVTERDLRQSLDQVATVATRMATSREEVISQMRDLLFSVKTALEVAEELTGCKAIERATDLAVAAFSVVTEV